MNHNRWPLALCAVCALGAVVWWALPDDPPGIVSEAASPESSGPEHSLLAKSPLGEKNPLVVEEPDVDLGPTKGPLKHRFTYRNQSESTIRINDITASCACLVTKSDLETLAPGQAGFVALETDLTKKEPGPHRFTLTIAYEAPDAHTATASIKAYYQPDLRVVPAAIDLTVTESETAKTTLALIDYRREPLSVKGVETSTPTLAATVIEKPTEFLGGWRYVLDVSYHDSPNMIDEQRRETIRIRTSDSERSTIEVPVVVRRLERIRVAPKSIKLSKAYDKNQSSARIFVRDSLGEKIEIEGLETRGLAVAQFDPQPAAAKLISFFFSEKIRERGNSPLTILIKVKKPCTKTIPVTVNIEP